MAVSKLPVLMKVSFDCEQEVLCCTCYDILRALRQIIHKILVTAFLYCGQMVTESAYQTSLVGEC